MYVIEQCNTGFVSMDTRIVLFPENVEMARCMHLPRRHDDPVTPLCVGWQHEKGWLREINWDNEKRTGITDEKEFLLFHYTLSGRGMVQDERGEHVLGPGQAFFFPVPCATRHWLPHDWDWEWIWISAAGEAVMALARNLVRQHGYIYELPPHSGAVAVLAQLYQQRIAGHLSDPESASAEVYRFLMELARTARQQDDSPGHGIDQALREIESSFSDPQLDVTALAEAAGMTRSHFTRLFSEETGQSPGKAIEARRLRHAAELLAFSHAPVKHVAAACGYSNTSHFCAMFRKRFGVTPAKYRG